jgi:RNA polymerase sigma-70 factor (ECF subfamily)
MQQMSVILDESLKAELYQRTAPVLLAYLLRQISSREDAEDLLLEVFLAALENEKFRALPIDKQHIWLRKVAHNKVVDYYRRSNRYTRVPIVQVVDTIFDREELEPEQMALKNEEYARLHKTMRGLPKAQRELLELRFGHGLSCIEIASLQEKSEGAVRMLLSRTLKALRTLYARG